MREAGMRRWERSFEACWGAINETTSNILRPADTTSSWFWETETRLKLLEEFQLCCGKNYLRSLPLRVISWLSGFEHCIQFSILNTKIFHFLSSFHDLKITIVLQQRNYNIPYPFLNFFRSNIWQSCLHNNLWAKINVILIIRWQESILAQNIRILGSLGHQRPEQNIIKYPDTRLRQSIQNTQHRSNLIFRKVFFLKYPNVARERMFLSPGGANVSTTRHSHPQSV